MDAKNYVMQKSFRPTRDEVNKAHQQRISLDIGIPSIRNMRRNLMRENDSTVNACTMVDSSSSHNSAGFSTLSTHLGTILYCLYSTS